MLSWLPQSPVTSDAPIEAKEEPLETTEIQHEQPHTEEALPHDRILGNLFNAQGTSDKGLNGSFRASALDNNNAIYDPFDGTYLGTLVAPDHNVQPEEGGKLNDDVAAKSEELWSHLSTVLEIQNQLSRMHLDMEEIGLNDPKGKGKGTRSRATSVSRVVIDDIEADEGIGGKRDEEAERNKAREEQFLNLAGQFRGKKEAITAIMIKLDSLSRAVTEFHALQAPKIDFLSSRENSLPATNTTAENQFVDLHTQFNPVRKSSLPPNVLKRVAEPATPVFSESPMSIEMPLPP
ncbi:hypothetical protein MVEN_01527000 [Mycena venus]|uniref:Uncharacterized protein n=1 Tax=Mycena venus TaxID=2733690 RepID=A0A8H7CUA9_9AGAR|nr:hypothetical protein MVEN_01527000 [Mycena venus]